MAYNFQPIALMGNESFNPMESLAQSAQLQGAYQQNQIRQMQLAEMIRQSQDAQAQRGAAAASVYGAQSASAISPAQTLGSMGAPDGQPMGTQQLTIPQQSYGANLQAGSDPSRYLASLAQSAPHLVPGVQAQMAKAEQDRQDALLGRQEKQATINKNNAEAGKFTADAQKAQYDTHVKQLDIFSSATGFLTKLPPEVASQLYPQVVQAAGAAAGLPPEQMQGFLQQHPTYDPAFVETIQKATISSKDQMKAQQDQKFHEDEVAHWNQQDKTTRRGQDMTDARAKDANKMKVGVPYEQLPPAEQTLVDQIGTGKMSFKDLARIATSNPGLLGAVAQKYPEFDQGKITSAVQAQRDFTSAGKYGIQLNSGSTAMRHFAQLRDINDNNATTVRIPGTAANKAYNNLLDTVAGEVATFYGMPKTNETLAGIKGTLGGLTNRDAAINEQAKAMGEKFDELENTWKEAQPSAAYHRPMPGYSEESKAARAKLDPEYAKRLQGTPQGGGQVINYKIINGQLVPE